ncbi:hypothetical protein D3M70_07690 [Pseudomonas sp. LS-2]|jgi:hypothetical protein|nr:hypothetical protein D3M70_07690 [Pseudomonas sp. LS-2]
MQSLSYGHWGLILVGSLLTSLISTIWFTYKKIDFLEERLLGCRCITDTKNLWQGGFIGRHMRLNMVFMVTYMPGIMHRRGLITENAHLNIPRYLRGWIWGIYLWLFSNGIAMAILCYLIKRYP